MFFQFQEDLVKWAEKRDPGLEISPIVQDALKNVFLLILSNVARSFTQPAFCDYECFPSQEGIAIATIRIPFDYFRVELRLSPRKKFTISLHPFTESCPSLNEGFMRYFHRLILSS